MAVTDYDNLSSVTREKILPGITDAISKDNPGLRWALKRGKRKDGGRRIEEVIKYIHSTQGGSYSGLQVLDTAQETTRTRGIFNWRFYHQPIPLSYPDIAMNGGIEKVFDLAATEAQEAGVDLRDKMSTALYTAQTGTAFDSLVDGCDDGTNTASYGGITRSTYTWEKGSYTASGGAYALSTLNTTWDAVSSGQRTPTIGLTTEAMWTAHEALLAPHMRINFTSGGGYPLVDGGFKAIYHRGCPIIADEYATAGYLYFLRDDTWVFSTMNHPAFPTDQQGFTTTKFRETTNQDGQIAFILFYGNLICIEPRRNGVIRGLT